jgi:hypothetical protein
MATPTMVPMRALAQQKPRQWTLKKMDSTVFTTSKIYM